MNIPARLLLIIALLSSIVWVGQSRADVNRTWARYNGWEVTAFQVEGLSPEMAGFVSPRLALAGTRKILRVHRPGFQVKLLAEDLARIRLYLAREGYPLARTYAEADPVPESRQLALKIRVETGPRVLVENLTFAGWPERAAIPDSTVPRVLRVGETFRDEDVERTSAFLQRWLQDQGFATAQVTYRVTRGAGGGIDLHYLIVPGEYFIIDSLEISGSSEDLEGVARRVANLHPPVEYSESLLENLATDLRWTQLFRQVEVKTRSTTPGHLAVQAQLEDARMRIWTASVGTWADNPLVAEVGWTHRNLFGHGVGFDSFAKVATHELNAGAGVYWLGWLSPRARTRAGLEFLVEDEDAYRSREEILELVQAFRPNNRDAWKVGITNSLVDVEVYNAEADETPEDQGWLLEFWSDWKWDRTDNPIFPTRGAYLKVSGSVAPPMRISDAPYVAGQVDLAAFRPLVDKFTVTGRLRVGLATPLGDADDLLVNRRFYAGGFNTMRGFKRRELGPEDTKGNPRGGQSTLLAGIELRFPLYSIFDGAVFLDTGQVWRETGKASLGDLAVAWGAAVDLRTPIGPLRVNYARNLGDLQPGQSKRLWLFGIGYPW